MVVKILKWGDFKFCPHCERWFRWYGTACTICGREDHDATTT